MSGQMSIFDYIEAFDPLRRVAQIARPYWRSSKGKLVRIRDEDPDIKRFAHAVKHEFCPYGAAGQYGCNRHERDDLLGYDMRTEHISVYFFDQIGQKQTRIYSWEDFAREISDKIWRGEWSETRQEEASRSV